MLTHGGASSPRVRCPSLRNPHSGSVRSAHARPGNDSIIAPIGFAQRTQMTDWSNVVRPAMSKVLPTS
jgi:hypothetical protein